MREDKANNKRQSPVKLALAAVLTVAFVVVVVVQVKTYSDDATVSAEQGSPEREPRSQSERSPAMPSQHARSEDSGEPRVTWSEVNVAQCTAYDPFKAPEGFAPKQEKAAPQNDSSEVRQQQIAAAQRQAAERQAIAELMETGVNAVFVGLDRRTAIVGNQRLELGQEIHGHRVIAIEPHGVVLEPIEPEPTGPTP